MGIITAASAEVCTALAPAQVKVGGEIGRRLEATVENNLLVIDLDRDFLKPFQERKSTSGYVGIGKTIDAYARFAAYTGDERVLDRKRHLVKTLLECQEPDGYLGMFRPDARITSLWDVHEMAYIVLGLTSDYQFCGEQASLDAARKLADHLIAKMSGPNAPKVGPDDLSDVMPTTGLDEAFLYLSDQCGDARYRDFVVKDRGIPEWRMPLVLGRWGKIDGHAYAYMSRSLAQVRLTRHLPEEGLWETTKDVFRFLLDGDGLVITGTCSDHECWHNTQSGTTNLGETCATAYLLRFYDELLRQTGIALYGDLMERAIYNALFGAQSPDGRRIRYYTPFEAPRAYHETDTYCCPCNYRRILPDLPRMIYYRQGEGVYVNLYTLSTAEIPLQNDVILTLRQETDYPNSGRVRLTIGLAQPIEFTLCLRVPRWSPGVQIRVNGESATPEASGEGRISIRRTWKNGDTVDIEFPMAFRLVKGRRTQEGRAAIMRGPLIFTYNPERNPDLRDKAPRLFALDPSSIEGPFPDDSVHPGGLSCRVKIWEPGAWYPFAATRQAILTEYADPDAVATYFLTPNPNDARLVEDELAGTAELLFEKSTK